MDIFTSLKISSSALAAQQVRMNTISSNLANVETTRTPEGGPYRKQEVVFRTSSFAGQLDTAMRGAVRGVEVAEIRANPAPPRMVYDPSHPDADEAGMVAMPNLNVLEETVDMMRASSNYGANVTAIQASKRMALKALEIGR